MRSQNEQEATAGIHAVSAGVRVLDFESDGPRGRALADMTVRCLFEFRPTRVLSGTREELATFSARSLKGSQFNPDRSSVPGDRRGDREYWVFAREPPSCASLISGQYQERGGAELPVSGARSKLFNASPVTCSRGSMMQWCSSGRTTAPEWLRALPPYRVDLAGLPGVPDNVRGHWLIRHADSKVARKASSFWFDLKDVVVRGQLGMSNAVAEWLPRTRLEEQDSSEAASRQLPDYGTWEIAIFCESRYCLQVRTALSQIDAGRVIQSSRIPYRLRNRTLFEA